MPLALRTRRSVRNRTLALRAKDRDYIVVLLIPDDGSGDDDDVFLEKEEIKSGPFGPRCSTWPS